DQAGLTWTRTPFMPFTSSWCALGTSSSQEAPQSFHELLDVEVDEESLSQVQELEIGQHLCLMDRQQAIDGFQFDDQLAGDHEVDSILRIEHRVPVENRNGHLAGELDVLECHLAAEAVLVRRLQQAWPKRSMHFDGTAD